MANVVVVQSKCLLPRWHSRLPSAEFLFEAFTERDEDGEGESALSCEDFVDLRPVGYESVRPRDIPFRAGGGIGGAWCNAEDTVVIRSPSFDTPMDVAMWVEWVLRIRPHVVEAFELDDVVYLRWWWD